MRIFILSVLSLLLLLPVTASASVPWSCVALTQNLSFGSKSSEVLTLQQFLIAQSVLASDSATGYFGKLTEAAVKEWQVQHGVVSSGTPATTGYGSVGPKTRKAMASACNGVNKNVGI